MGNPVRHFTKFMTVWEKLDFEAQGKYAANIVKTLRQLRSHRRDLDERIEYWEGNLDNVRKARRRGEANARAREYHDRVTRPKKGRTHKGRFDVVAEKNLKSETSDDQR
jgi:hypothetical protein